MVHTQPDTNDVRPTIAEWWATFASTQAGRLQPILFLVIALGSLFVGPNSPAVSMRSFVAALSFMLAVIYWERLGFVCLLARRQGEIRRLQDEKGTV